MCLSRSPKPLISQSRSLKPCTVLQAPNYIAMVYDMLDRYLLGGTQWGWTDNWTPANHDGWNQENFSITDQRRQIRSNFAIRAYPRAIAGIPGPFKVTSRSLSCVGCGLASLLSRCHQLAGMLALLCTTAAASALGATPLRNILWIAYSDSTDCIRDLTRRRIIPCI